MGVAETDIVHRVKNQFGMIPEENSKKDDDEVDAMVPSRKEMMSFMETLRKGPFFRPMGSFIATNPCCRRCHEDRSKTIKH